MIPLLEVCVESLQDALAAEEGGADRIELCADLSVGGLSPGRSLLRAVLAHVTLPVVVMVRPRPGDFRYDEGELAGMEREVVAAHEAGAAGVVLGLLDGRNEVDRRALERMVGAAEGLPVVFHRAFDRTPDADAALGALLEAGVARLLCSGHAPDAERGAAELARLVARATPLVGVMPGGGVRASNAGRILGRTGARELHSSVTGGTPLEPAAVAELVEALRA